VANAGSSTIDHYSKKGAFVFQVNTVAQSVPTGLVANCSSSKFLGASLITVTLGGTIEYYKPATSLSSTIVVSNPHAGVFTGAAISKNNFFVANFGNFTVDIYDSNLVYVSSFSDPALTAIGYAPYNVYVNCKHIYVAFAKNVQNDAVDGAGLGFIDRFDLSGNKLKRIINNGPLNAPWGMILSPCEKYLLVGNNGSQDGRINVFDICNCYDFVTPILDCNGNPISNTGLWGITYSHCGTLLGCAGINQENSGLIFALEDCCESSSSSKKCKKIIVKCEKECKSSH
jgi:uncharacterized protein (TIGR03118 family)